MSVTTQTTRSTASDLAAIARAEAEASVLDKAAAKAVKAWTVTGARHEAAEIEVGKLVFRFVDGEELGKVLGVPIATTYEAGTKNVKTAGLDRRWGIDEAVIRDLRDLGGIAIQAEALGLAYSPTNRQAARKLLGDLPKADDGSAYRGAERFTNGATEARLRAFSVDAEAARAAEPNAKLSQIKLAEGARKAAPGPKAAEAASAATSWSGDLTRALDKVSAALRAIQMPEDAEGRAERIEGIQAAFKAIGLNAPTEKAIGKARAWKREAAK